MPAIVQPLCHCQKNGQQFIQGSENDEDGVHSMDVEEEEAEAVEVFPPAFMWKPEGKSVSIVVVSSPFRSFLHTGQVPCCGCKDRLREYYKLA